jgi:hypothetical protein
MKATFTKVFAVSLQKPSASPPFEFALILKYSITEQQIA